MLSAFQIPELPPGVEGMDVYIGIALTLFVVDRVMFLVKNFRKDDTAGVSKMQRQITDIHDWLGAEDPETGAKYLRLTPIELRALRTTLERLTDALTANTAVLRDLNIREDQREHRRA